jgi:hypothetical protein
VTPVRADPHAAIRRRIGAGSQAGGSVPTARKERTFERGPLISAVLLALIGATTWVATRFVADERRFPRECQEFAAYIRATDVSDDAACRAALERIDGRRDLWQGYSTELEVRDWRDRIEKAVEARDRRTSETEQRERLRRRTEFEGRLAAAIATADAPTSTTDDLLDTRRTVMDTLASAADIAPECEEECKAAIIQIDHVLVRKMRDEAKAFTSASTTTPHQGLAKYAIAEDYVRKAIEDAKKSNNKADDAAYTEIYKGLLQDSDEYSAKVITPAFIASIPWKDLLDGDMATKWSKTINVPGFSCRIANGTLTLTPPDPGMKLQGVAAVLDQRDDNLRHFVLEMDFSCEGDVTMYFHVSPPPNAPNGLQSEAYDLLAKQGFLEAGAKYTLIATYIGSDLKIRVTPDDDGAPDDPSGPSWAKRRRGGIAFLVPEGARLTITRMRIKELR